MNIVSELEKILGLSKSDKLIEWIKETLKQYHVMGGDSKTDVKKMLIEKLRKDFPDQFSKFAEKIGKSLSEIFKSEQFDKIIDLAWNYKEVTVQEYTIKEAISWMKENFDKEKHSAGCMYRVPKENDSDENITLHLFFFDKYATLVPCLDGSSKHQVVNCLKIDENLEKQFGDKNQLVFK